MRKHLRKDTSFTKKLGDLFKMKYVNAIKIINIKEDKEF